jgi:hypothetical protein
MTELRFESAKQRWMETRQLGALWRFPSDHLPVGCTFTEDGLRVVSWNVLDYSFRITNIEGQGLIDSLPYSQYREIGLLPPWASPEERKKAQELADAGEDSQFPYMRDLMVLRTLDALMQNSTRRVHVFALQECSQELHGLIMCLCREHGYANADLENSNQRHGNDTVVLYDQARLRLMTPFDKLSGGVTMVSNIFAGKDGTPKTETKHGKKMKVVRWERVDARGEVCGPPLCVVAGKVPGDNKVDPNLSDWACFVQKFIVGESGQPVPSQKRVAKQHREQHTELPDVEDMHAIMKIIDKVQEQAPPPLDKTLGKRDVAVFQAQIEAQKAHTSKLKDLQKEIFDQKGSACAIFCGKYSKAFKADPSGRKAGAFKDEQLAIVAAAEVEKVMRSLQGFEEPATEAATGSAAGSAAAAWGGQQGDLRRVPILHMHTLFLGDYNFMHSETLQAAANRGLSTGVLRPVRSPHKDEGSENAHGDARDEKAVSCESDCMYPTCITPLPRAGEENASSCGGGPLSSKRIDHMLEAHWSSAEAAQCQLLTPEQLLLGLSDEVAVLECSGPSGSQSLPSHCSSVDYKREDSGDGGGGGSVAGGARKVWEMGAEEVRAWAADGDRLTSWFTSKEYRPIKGHTISKAPPRQKQGKKQGKKQGAKQTQVKAQKQAQKQPKAKKLTDEEMAIQAAEEIDQQIFGAAGFGPALEALGDRDANDDDDDDDEDGDTDSDEDTGSFFAKPRGKSGGGGSAYAADPKQIDAASSVIRDIMNGGDLDAEGISKQVASMQSGHRMPPFERVSLYFFAAFDGDVAKVNAKQLHAHMDDLRSFVDAPAGDERLNCHKRLLGCCERLCGVVYPELQKVYPVLLKTLYDEDMLDEEHIVSWGGLSAEFGFSDVTEEMRSSLAAANEPLLRWLKEAEADSSSGEGSSSEGSD